MDRGSVFSGHTFLSVSLWIDGVANYSKLSNLITEFFSKMTRILAILHFKCSFMEMINR